MLRICYYCINIQLTTVQVYHCFEVFVIPEPSCPAFDILDNAVHTFQDGICKAILEVIQYLIPVVANHASEFLRCL